MATSALEYLAKTVAADGWTLKTGERVGVYTVLNRLGQGHRERSGVPRMNDWVAMSPSKSCCRTRRVTRRACVALLKKHAWPGHSTIRTC